MSNTHPTKMLVNYSENYMLFKEQLNQKSSNLQLKYIDLFCGIGGFRIAVELACSQYKIQDKKIEPICVFSSDIDAHAQKNYEVNFKATFTRIS